MATLGGEAGSGVALTAALVRVHLLVGNVRLERLIAAAVPVSSVTAVCGGLLLSEASWTLSKDSAMIVPMELVGIGVLGKNLDVSNSCTALVLGMQKRHTLCAFCTGPTQCPVRPQFSHVPQFLPQLVALACAIASHPDGANGCALNFCSPHSCECAK